MSAYSDKIIADGASNYWRLGETSGLTAVDVVGGKNGTISGGVTLAQPGVAGETAMGFNGTTGWIQTTPVTIPLLSTIEVWIKTGSVPAQRPVFFNSSSSVAVAVNAGRATFVGSNFSPGVKLVDDGQWHHLAFVLTSGTVTIYVDGQLDVAKAETRSAPSTLALFLAYDAATTFWAGSLDDLAIYPRALSAGEIAAHYSLGVPTTYAARVAFDGASNHWRLGELSGTTAVDVIGAKNGTISGGVTLAQPGAIADGDKAMVFNGTTGKIVTAANVAMPLTTTVEAWLKSTSTADVQIIGTALYGSGHNLMAYRMVTGRLGIYCVSATVVTGSVDTIATFNDGVWHHVAWVRTGQTVQIYVDGLLAPITGALPTGIAADTQPVEIGYYSNGPMYFPGGIDDVSIYPRALTAAEIAAHYTAGTTSAGGSRNQLSFGYWKKVWSAA